jgi:hypothetical protein
MQWRRGRVRRFSAVHRAGLRRECRLVMTPARVDALLYELCAKLGFCLRHEDWARLRERPPLEVDAFTDAVFMAEGMRPESDLHLRREVHKRVREHFRAAEDAELFG